ncbi:MAG: 16S rRNA (guanine(527)-N(7))-methyltransferase RsmG [Pseudomonadota bacterium]
MTLQPTDILEDVSRETRDRLEILARLIAKWTPAINLIAPSTVPEIWTRHIRDSAQIVPLIPVSTQDHLDLGTGSGCPGLVVAAIAAEIRPDLHTTLIEADQRKAAFLRTAIREMGLTATLFAQRIEEIEIPQADLITARAFAPLSRLLSIAQRFCHAQTRLILHKGRQLDSELTEARRDWHIEATVQPSLTAPDAAILTITRFAPRGDPMS